MPAPLSDDLRQRVIDAWRQGQGTLEQLAETFRIGRTTLRRWVDRFRTTGSVDPLPHGGGHPSLIPPDSLGIVMTLVEEHNDATLPQLAQDYSACTDQPVSCSTLGRALKRLDITRKKKRPRRPNAPPPMSSVEPQNIWSR